MRIDWKLKSALFCLIDFAKLNRLLFFIQEKVTRRAFKAAGEIRKEWIEHHRTFEQQLTQKNVLLEIGAGKNIGQNLVLSTLFEKQFVLDVTPMFSPRLTHRARSAVSEVFTLRSNSAIQKISDLSEYGIIYKAPFAVADALTLLKDHGGADAIASTNTFEHIPESDIDEVIKDLHSALDEDGLGSVIIDYSDHYAHTDPNIGPFNFMRFSDKQWKRHNHSCHFQNRLRHPQYIAAFAKAGFEVEVARVTRSSEQMPDYLDERFRELADLDATSAHFLLRKKPRSH